MITYDLSMHGDPRLAMLPPGKLMACMGLWYLAAGWSLAWDTGGFVPIRQVEMLGATQTEARQLVAAGLWRVAEVPLGSPPRGYLIVWPARPAYPELAEIACPAKPSSRRDAANSRASRYRARKRDASRDARDGDGVTVMPESDAGSVTVTRDGDAEGRDASRDGGLGGALNSPSLLSSPSVSPSPLGSESTQEAGCNAPAREEPPNPARFRAELEELVRAEFFARRVTPQKAAASQWRDGCQTIADALELGAYPDAHAAMQAFAVALVDACAAGKPLGLALQQTPLGAKLKPPAAGGRQLSELALATLARARAEGT